MPATFSKEFLSGSSGGKQIKVAQTATAGTLLHTTGSSASVKDEVWLYATNNDTQTRTLTIEFGGVASPDDLIKVNVPSQTGLMLLVPGFVLSGDGSSGKSIRAFASTADVISISGFVNRITPP